MPKNIEFYINNQQADFSNPNDLGFEIYRQGFNFEKLVNVAGDYTLGLELPKTIKNLKILQFIGDPQSKYNFFIFKDFEAQIRVDNVTILKGKLNVDVIKNDTIEVTILGNNSNWIERISETTLRELKTLRDVPYSGIKSENFQPWPQQFTGSIGLEDINNETTLDNPSYTKYDFCLPLICYGNFPAPPNDDDPYSKNLGELDNPLVDGLIQVNESEGIITSDLFVNDFEYPLDQLYCKPAVFVKPVIKAIFQEAGYKATGEFINDSTTDDLILPFIDSDNNGAPWNYRLLGQCKVNGKTPNYVPNPEVAYVAGYVTNKDMPISRKPIELGGLPNYPEAGKTFANIPKSTLGDTIEDGTLDTCISTIRFLDQTDYDYLFQFEKYTPKRKFPAEFDTRLKQFDNVDYQEENSYDINNYANSINSQFRAIFPQTSFIEANIEVEHIRYNLMPESNVATPQGILPNQNITPFYNVVVALVKNVEQNQRNIKDAALEYIGPNNNSAPLNSSGAIIDWIDPSNLTSAFGYSPSQTVTRWNWDNDKFSPTTDIDIEKFSALGVGSFNLSGDVQLDINDTVSVVFIGAHHQYLQTQNSNLELYAMQTFLEVKGTPQLQVSNIRNPNNNNEPYPFQLNPADFLPDMEQKELIKSLSSMFNLFIQVDETTKTASIDYYKQNLFSPQSSKVWDTKTSEETFKVEPSIKFDEIVWEYTKEDGEVLFDWKEESEFRYNINNQNNKEIKTFEPKFARTGEREFVLVRGEGENFFYRTPPTPCFNDQNEISKPLKDFNDNAKLRYDWKPRILEWQGNTSLNNLTDNAGNSLTVEQLRIGYYNPFAPNLNNQFVYAANYPLAQWPQLLEWENLFDNYWEGLIRKLETSVKITAQVQLKNTDVFEFNPRIPVVIKGQVYIINKIDGFNPISDEPTDVIIYKA